MERARTQQHILILEDDCSIAELLVWILSDAGYRVTCVQSLREARRVCAQSLPDVIIADLLLPDGFGSDFVGEMTSAYNGSSPASIVLSAVPEAHYYAHAAGANLCLSKPFDLADLLDSISRLLGSGKYELQSQ